MINHIDLGTVLRKTVCDLYSDLVTRPTGAAVRTGIEQQLAEAKDRTLTVIDFTHVGLLDFSCADEIVAKGDDERLLLIGTVDDRERRAWEAVTRLGRAVPADIAMEVGVEEPQAESLLATLSRRRLIMRFDEGYVAVGAGP